MKERKKEMVCQRCHYDGTAFGGADCDTASCEYGLYGQRFCEHGAVRRDCRFSLRAGLHAHGQPDRKAVCDIDLYDASRHNFFPDGQLVFASLFYRRGLSL